MPIICSLFEEIVCSEQGFWDMVLLNYRPTRAWDVHLIEFWHGSYRSFDGTKSWCCDIIIIWHRPTYRLTMKFIRWKKSDFHHFSLSFQPNNLSQHIRVTYSPQQLQAWTRTTKVTSHACGSLFFTVQNFLLKLRPDRPWIKATDWAQ